MWVDAASPDLDASKKFYSELFGWQVNEVPDPAAGGYAFFMKDEKMVGGLGPTMGPGQPAAWTMYVRTPDVDATARTIQEQGGQVVAGPMDVRGAGRIAWFADPTGAHLAALQPSEQTQGSEIVNEVGSFTWSDLGTRDMPAAKEFYAKVFGWNPQDRDIAGNAYTEFQVDGRSIAGGMDISGLPADEVPPNWLIYFRVDSIDDAFEKAKELGGSLANGPFEFPQGRFTILRDPVGAFFAVVEYKQA
jgi:predicted enzyme related to lactoylglutathione lyase